MPAQTVKIELINRITIPEIITTKSVLWNLVLPLNIFTALWSGKAETMNITRVIIALISIGFEIIF